ncbi:MAG TPA: FAD binding domain-containing protein [Actinomycetota bacterium]|nr:FAD binding domain-containing protein [Actinomycetota bacterium]
MEVLLPRSLEEALALKASTPDAVPIAGGTDLMVEINFDRLRPEALIDLTRVPELASWRLDGELLFVGAGMTYARLLRELPHMRALVEASRSVGSPQVRNRGTLGGNLGTASPAGDALPVLAAHDAEVVLTSAARGERSVSWDAFLVGVKRTSLLPDELILGARWRVLGGPQSFSKVGTRNAMVIAVASLCFALDPRTRTARVALGSVAPTVVRAGEAEAFLASALERAGAWDEPATPLDEETIEGFAERVAAAARPIDDVRGSAAYRRHAVRVLARRALRWAVRERATEAMVS